MLKKIILCGFLFILALGAWVTYISHDAWIRQAASALIEKNTRDILNGPLRFDGFNLDRHFKIHIRKVEGTLKTKDGLVPFELGPFFSKDSLWLLIKQQPVSFHFEGMRPQGSSSRGIEGDLLYDPSGSGSVALQADIHELFLQELQALNPENLSGASGRLSGNLNLFETFDMEKQSFKLELYTSEDGGTLQAKFFDVFLPYLPAIERKHMNKLKESKTVAYKRAVLSMELVSKENMKVLLRILVPDYNLNLNLNAQIRLEEGHSFTQIAELLGLFEVKI